MKKVDQLILKELVWPWIGGVTIFTVLIMAATYLFRLTSYLLNGIPLSTILEFSTLIIPSILVKTFAMAALLSPLLAFGRLSSDSEIVALKACGTSVVRMMRPAAILGVLVSIISFLFNEIVVPSASNKAQGMKVDLAITQSKKGAKPKIIPVYDNGFLQATISAKSYRFTDQVLIWPTIISYDKSGAPSYILTAHKMFFEKNKWKLEGGGKLISTDGQTYVHIKEDVWPQEIPKLQLTPNDLLVKTLSDGDALSFTQIRSQLKKMKGAPDPKKRQINNLEYSLWNKFANPLTALVFSLLGASLGIRHQRTSTSSGFWLAIVISFGYLIFTNMAAIYAKSGTLPPIIASFSPLALGLLASGMIIYKKSL